MAQQNNDLWNQILVRWKSDQGLRFAIISDTLGPDTGLIISESVKSLSIGKANADGWRKYTLKTKGKHGDRSHTKYVRKSGMTYVFVGSLPKK